MLAELKKEGESFTELILRITAPLKKKKLSEFAGIMAGPEFDDFEKAVLELRHQYTKSTKTPEITINKNKKLQKAKI